MLVLAGAVFIFVVVLFGMGYTKDTAFILMSFIAGYLILFVKIDKIQKKIKGDSLG